MSKRYLKFWGTRGSIAVSGPEYSQFGGSTSCLELVYDDHYLIFDAGTGIRALGEELINKKIDRLSLIISHYHWDHLSGFPFFRPVYDKNNQVDLYGPQTDLSLRESIEILCDNRYFPGPIGEVIKQINFSHLEAGSQLVFGELLIECYSAFHPGGALCYKIITPQKTIGYCTDNEFLKGYLGSYEELNSHRSLLEPYQGLIDFYRNCDLLVHEAQYNVEEYAQRIGWGHTSINNACILLKLTGVKEHMVIHHDPKATDDLLRKRCKQHQEALDELQTGCHVTYVGDAYMINLD